jgi:hypothetical protein
VNVRSGGDGELTGHIAGGQAVALGQGQTTLQLDPENKVIIDYDGIEDLLHVINVAENKNTIRFNVLGLRFELKPGEERSILLSTAEEEDGIPEIPESDYTEHPDEGREPISPVTA